MKKNEDDSLLEKIIKGPSKGYTDNFPKRSMWKEIVSELNGDFNVSYEGKGHALEIHKVSVPYKKWMLEISVSDSRPLKFRVLFSAVQDFELILSWEGLVERIMKKLGKTEVEVGWKAFDKHYLIESNNPALGKQVLTKNIQQVLLKHNVYSIAYTTDSDTGKAELLSVIQRRAGEKEMILELIGMFKALIDQLKESGVIR